MQYINEWVGQGEITSKKKLTISDPRRDYDVTDLVIVCKRRVKNEYKSTPISCEAWGVLSDYCDKLEVGDWVRVKGRFEHKVWRSKGGECQKNLIVVEGIEKV